MIDLDVRLEGLDEVIAWLDEVEEILGDASPMFDDVVAPYLRRHAKRQFETRGRHGGTRWASTINEKKYRRRKKALGAVVDPLRWKPGRQERLYPSLTRARHHYSRWERTREVAIFGTTLEYAKRLEVGGIGPLGEPFPGRPILVYTKRQRRALIKEAEQYTDARIERAKKKARVTP